MISRGIIRRGSFVEGDAVSTSICYKQVSLGSQNVFKETLVGPGLFISPNPTHWLIPAIEKYLSGAVAKDAEEKKSLSSRSFALSS